MIKTRTEALTKVLQEVGTIVYQQATQQQATQQQATQQPTKNDDQKEKVIDADYKVVDEKDSN
jgi:molecular chaperone DnaK